jgi:flagellar hook-basal body protein
MIRCLWTAASGMQAQTSNIDVISNNLANVNTAGFKRSRAEFQDLLYETLRPPGTSTPGDGQVPTGIQIGHGTRTVATQKVFIQGDFQHTQNELDMAIEGDGFFKSFRAMGRSRIPVPEISRSTVTGVLSLRMDCLWSRRLPFPPMPWQCRSAPTVRYP